MSFFSLGRISPAWFRSLWNPRQRSIESTYSRFCRRISAGIHGDHR